MQENAVYNQIFYVVLPVYSYIMMKERKTALITGASKGMGRAISFSLAKLDYNLLLCARNISDLQWLKTQIQEEFSHIDIQILSVDFSIPNAVQEVIAAFGDPQVDVLINNVGMFVPDSVLDTDPSLFLTQMQVNVHTPRDFSAHWGSLMKTRKRGHIINISSIASRHPHVNAGSYTVTKFALNGLTKVLREALKPYGVKVTEIVPGSTFTASWEGSELPKEQFVQPEDIAQAVVLCLTSSAGANVDELVVTPVQEV